ncbi:MAG: LamG-like jellyroll fold domain-containing protein, partial [Pseudomonadota bacterium]
PEASGPTADGWDRIVFSTDAPVSGSGTFSDIELWWDSIAFFDPAETNSGVTSNASYLDSDWLSLETKLGASVISNPNGLNGTTYNFDGSNDYLEIYDPGNDLVLGGSMSFVIDVLFDHKSQDWSKVFDFGAGRADSNLLLTQYSDTDDMRVEWWDYQGNRIGNLKVNDVIEPGTWMQLAVTITDEGHVSFYKNGALLKDQDFDPVPIESRPNLYIGKSHWSGDKYFEGQIGTFAIFDTALPGFAVQQMYDETSPMYDFL